MAKIITIASGKGGVGKTSISLNLSLSLAAQGHRVCLFDGDLGLANVNILTRLFPDHGLEEVISGEYTLGDIMIKNFQGIDIIPGSSGVEKIADLGPEESKRLITSFLGLSAYDYFILDTSAGISSQVLSFCRASHEMILVATPEPTSLTDAYSLLKVLSRYKGLPRVRVVINHVKTAAAAKKAYARLKETVHKFLSIKISPLGIVAEDPKVSIAVVSQVPFYMLFPDTDASRCIRAIAQKLSQDPKNKEDLPVELFWDQCLQFLSLQKQMDHDHRRKGRKGVAGKRSDPDQTMGLTSASQADLQKKLAGIEDKISLLLDEVGQIKTLLKENTFQADKKEEAAPMSQRMKPPAPGLIPLDFESWEQKQV
ncbi:MAG: MinD/ParA family protein [Desulfobacula sp.]|nr:MinD/ParA family protein [Desulfobacula sp.]